RLRALHVAGDVFHPVDDVFELATRPEYRCVDDAPVALLETSAVLRAARDRVVLDTDHVRDQGFAYPLQRAARAGDAVRARGGLFGKDLEQRSPDDLVAPRTSRLQVGFGR